MSAGAHSLELSGLAGDRESAIHRLDPRAKILGLLAVTIVAVSAPLGAWPVWVACGAVLVAVATLARVPPGAIWRRARIVLPLVVAVAAVVPLVSTGGAAYSLGPVTVHEAGLETFATVAIKATIGIVAAVLLSATTAFGEIVRGLEAMRTPRLLTLIAGLMHRYAFVIAGEVGRMRSALAARAYRPRRASQVGALGRVATALFLRSYARGERVHLAMLARGYTGRMPSAQALRLGRGDIAFVVAIVALLVPLRLASGVELGG